MTARALFRRAEDVVLRVLSLPEAERERAVEEACGADPALAAEVRSLLAHAGELGGFLEEPALGRDFKLVPPSPGGEADAAEDPWIGRSLGGYVLRSRIASGGMGTVYLAERTDDGFTQRVAVKLVKRGMDSEEVLRRFRAERRTLAALIHPNVARLLDGGATETGRPYIVMEHVEGEPLDRYCDRRRLGSAERLRLFLKVCDAVQFAHQNLVVHRDLKPSNVLVTADGTPKLLDFGISKVIAAGETPLLTAPEERRLTPEYASPEQVAGRLVNTTSDVYSLGVILYELLTGHSPYRFRSRTAAEIERVVLEQTLAAPSEAVMRADTRPATGGAEAQRITPDAVSRARRATPEQLRRRLRGDLDTIVLAALRKEPERRYASVEQLAGDLRRHLDGLPIAARKDSLGYRAAKFARRHALGTALAALAAALLAAGVIAVAWQAGVAARQRDEAFGARDQAEATTAFLQDMLGSVDPGAAGRDVTVHEVLDAAARRVDDLAAQPLVQASLRSTIGLTYLSLGLYDDAEEPLRKAYEARLALLGPRHHDVAESMSDLAALLYARRSLDEAATLLSGALEIFREVRGERNPDVAKALSSLGAVLRAQGRPDEAEVALRRSLEIRRAVSGDDGLDVAESLNNLGILLARDRIEEAEACLTEALAIRRARLAGAHPLVAQSTDNLAVLLHQKGDLDRAEPLYREALALALDRLGESHPEVAVTRKNLGVLLLARGDLAAAEELLRACLATRERIYPATDARVFLTRIDLADVLALRGSWEEAALLLEAALAAARDRSTPAGTRSRALDRAADVFAAHGDHARAAELRAEAGAR